MEETPLPEMQVKEKLILLENNILILGKVVTNMETDRFIYVYEPMALFKRNGQSYMIEYMPESPDKFYSFPADKIININNPYPEMIEGYNELLRSYEEKEIEQKKSNESSIMLH